MSRPSHLRQMQLQQQMADDESAALAAEIFDHFCVASTMRQTLGLYRNMCDTVGLRPGPLNEFYPKLKAKIRSWKAQALWKKFDARAAHRAYNKGNACTGTRVLVIGAGPCGLRTAIEAQLLGAKVVVVEKRDRISRNNVLHLWPFVITDLRNLGAKKFYGKFCAGSIDHISIRQLQCILLKVALLLGVEIHEGVSFLCSLEPSDGCGWRAQISPEDHAVSHYEFDVLIGADGKRNTLEGFKRKEFRGKLAIAITANFINKKTEAEAKAEEISGVAFIFNQSFFKELYATTGIDLENIVYYKDETHYFVMTAKKHSLIDKSVIIQDFADPAELLAPVNVNTEKLLDYAREAAEFSTKYQMPNLEFAVNHYGKPDVAMFDFTSMFAAETSCRVIVRKNYRLLQCLVGDSLLEPFWPTGSGCARGFLSSMDAAYAIKLWNNSKNSILGVLAQRESIYRLLAQTTPENLHRDIGAYTVDPATRYPNLNKTTVNVWQVKHLIDSDDKTVLEQVFMDTNAIQAVAPETPIRRKRRTGDTLPISTVLLRWIKAQLHGHEFSHQLIEVSECFTGGKVLCSLINRYRPDLVDLNTIKDCTPLECNELAFKILENDLSIPRVMTAKDSVNLENVDSKIWLNYLEQICEVFRGEIPHVKHPKLDFAELKEKHTTNAPDFSRLLKIGSRKSKSPMQDIDVGSVVRRSVLDEDRLKRQRRHGAENIPAQQDTTRRARKRRSQEKSTNIEERQQRIKEIEANRLDRQNKRRLHRFQQTENFYKSLHMLQANNFLRESDSSSPFEDYSIYLYRQQAPKFNDRVKDLERKLLYPDRERGIQSALPRGLDENFSDRIKSMEQRITSRGNVNSEKKPKDLLRSIGKLESTDWNIREIEKKIEQSKKTEIGKSKEKVPKWSKEQFLARQHKMAKPEKQESTEEKFKEIDQTLKNLDKQLKEGSILEVGERGRNKVASIAGQFVKKDDTPEEKIPSLPKSSSKVGLSVFNKQAASEKCHFCNQTVYLMEKTSTEGLILHRSCLKCHHCHTNLRLGAYAFDRDDPTGRFYCTQHFRLPAKAVRPVLRKPNKKRSIDQAQMANDENKTPVRTKGRPEDVVQLDMLDRGQTPERIEFENTDAMSDGEPSLENIIDENEWTDRNFLSGSDDLESDLSSSESSDDDSESDLFEEANGSPIGAQTLQLATDWIGKQRYSNMDDSDDEDFYDSSEGLLDDDADSQTEGEEFKKAREMRRQEVKLMPPPAYLPTDTETEVQTDSDSSSSDDVELNSATEISTDSEFDHDPIILEAPRIFIDDTHLRKPTKVQVKQSVINNMNFKTSTPNAQHQKTTRQQEIEFKPLVQVDPSLLSSNRMPLKNPHPGDYLLNKTPSTEGIASKKSLELKKRYLLGEQGIGNGIMKSGSTSILDSKLRNFHSNISECQRLLNPGGNSHLDRTKADDKSSESSKKDSEKENDIVENMNIINRDMKFSETVNTVLVENVLKGVSDVPLKPLEVETIDLSTPEKSVPIIDLTNIDTPSSMTKINQNFGKNVSIKNNLSDDVIDLTDDSPVKQEMDSKLFKREDSSEKPDISKDVKETIPDIITHTEEIKMENYSSDKSLPRESKQPASMDSNENKYVDTNENDIQETCIQVPNIPWVIKKKSEVESDSLSDTSSSLEEIPHFTLDSTTSPDTHNALEKIVPRVKVHDTSGALMQIDSLMIIDGKYIGDPEDLKHLEIPEGTVIDLPNENHVKDGDNVIKDKPVENLIKSTSKPELKFDTKNENKINTLKNLPLILESDEKLKGAKPTSLELSKTKIELEEDKDRTPTMEEGISDSETEFTGQVLTETELSDWTADDAVSENFVDIEFVLNSNKGTIKRNKRGKKKGLPKLKQSIKLPDPPKDCGILRNLDIEEIEFMDTGSEGSCAEAYAATNRTLLQNRGYIEFIETTPTKAFPARVVMDKLESDVAFQKDNSNLSEMTGNEILGIDYIEQGSYILNNDIDLKTPVNEVPVIFATKPNESVQVQSMPTDSLNDMDEDSLALITSQGAATNTTTTEESEAITVVTSPLESVPQIPDPQTTPSSSEKMDKTVSTPTMATKIPVRKLSTDEIRRKSSLDDTLKRKDSDEISYEEYVRKLQMKITQISNARDSIDVRKQKRKSSKGEMIENSPSNSVIESKSLSIFEPPKNNILLSNSQVEQVHKIPEIPTLTRKLEEITKERTKQKDLIHDLVMDKLQSKKQLNAEKRLNRSRNRSFFSPSGQASILQMAPNSCSSAAHYHSPSSDKKSNEATPLNKVKESPKETKDVMQAFATPFRPKQRPMSDNLDQINLTFDLGPRLSKTQSFCMYTKPSVLKSDSKDQRNQSQEKIFETPVPPPRSSRRIEDVNTEKLRAEARARARLKSNEDLGLSPEEKLKLLRKRYHLDLSDATLEKNTPITINKSDDMKARDRKMVTSKSVNDISAVHKNRSSDENFNAKSMEAVDFTSDPNLLNSEEKTVKSRRRKDPERRKSLIQAVSNFFNKKKEKESPSPPKEKTEGMFSRFRISPKSKDKSKEKDGTTYEQSNSQECLKCEISAYSSTPQLFKTTDEVSPPPIPPLPTNYQRSDDESCTNETREQKKQRAISKATRQAELKRLRIAQEIQREQEEIEVKLKELEARGVLIEKALRGEGQDIENLETSSIGATDEKLLKELLEIWRNITQLKKRDEELGIRQQELQLEHRHAQLKEELNMRLSCSKLDKSSADVAAEGAILNEMLEIVAKRAALRPNDTSIDRLSNDNDSDG